MRFSELMRHPETFGWLVDDVIPEIGVGFIAGKFGVGKSWISMDLVLAVATGQRWLKHFTVKQGPVLVIDEENALPLLVSRFSKMLRGRGIVDRDLPIDYALRSRMNFSPDRLGNTAPEFDELRRWVAEHKPALIVVDSLTRVHHADENSSSEMSQVLANMAQVASEGQCVVTVLHHAPHGADRMRGSIDIYGAADWSLFATKTGTPPHENIVITQDKARWATAIEPFGVRLVGDGETTVRVLHSGAQAEALSSAAQAILDAIAAAPDGGVYMSDLIETHGMPPERTFLRHKDRLVELGLVAETKIGRRVRLTIHRNGVT